MPIGRDMRMRNEIRNERDPSMDLAYGHTASYSSVARLAVYPRAVRAVRVACVTHPLSIMDLCHRVIRADGPMGGCLGGLDATRALIALEAAA